MSLTKRDEFIRYVPDNLLDISGLTRGKRVNIILPLKSNCEQEDFIVNLRLGAVLGTHTLTGKEVNSRKFHVRLYDKYKSSTQKVHTEEVTNFPVLIRKEYLEGDSIKLTLRLEDWTSGWQFIDRQGQRIISGSLRLHSLALTPPDNDQEYIELRVMN